MKISKMEATLLNVMGDDLTVANAARVSFHKNSPALVAGDVKLINYLAKHKHFSPFNHCFVSFRIKAPIFVARQLVKHKFMPFNEVSRRYVTEEPEFFWPDVWRNQAENVKQGSSNEASQYMQEEQWDGTEYTDCYSTADALVKQSVMSSLDWYNDMIENGVCAEQARMVLPLNLMTEWWWSGTLGAYADMLKLRLDPHTQQESREVAEMIRDQLMPKFPISLNALLENK